MKIDNLILQISGFTIRLIFKETEPFFKKRIKEFIKLYYKDFIFHKDSSHTSDDFKIYFVNRIKVDTFLNKKENKYYLCFYEKFSNRSLITFYYINLYHFQLILRKVLLYLLQNHEGFMLHASANQIYKKAILFVGPQGSGKSTMMRILNSRYSGLSDDGVIIKKIKNSYYYFSTSFFDKEWWVKRISYGLPIKAVCFLKKSKECRVYGLNRKQPILQKMIKQLWLNEEEYKNQLKYLINFIDDYNDFYLIEFNKKPQEVANTIKRL